MILSRPGKLLQAMSGSTTLPQPESILLFMGTDTIKDHADARGLGHLGPCWCLLWGPCQSEWLALSPVIMMTSKSSLLLRTMSGSVFPPEPRSVLKSVAHDTTGGHMDAWGLGHNLWPRWCLRTVPPLGLCKSVLPHGTIMSSWPRLLPWAMSGSVVQQYLGFGLMSVDPVVTMT